MDLKLSELVKKLNEATQIMQDDANTVYTIYENLETGKGEGNYKFSFEARKKEGPYASIPIGRECFRDEIKGMASPELLKKTPRFTLEPIYDELYANQLVPVIKSWSETIPQGFIETIGSTLDLPKDESLISAVIKPGEEITLTIDFAKIRGEA